MTAPAPPQPPRRPWPMAAVAVAIVASLGLYTFVRLRYAKPTRPHEPYAESVGRVQQRRLAEAGWRSADAAFERLVDLPDPRGNVRAGPPRPPEAQELAQLSGAPWHLPIEYSRVTAPAALRADQPYTVHFEAALDQARAQIVGFDVHFKGSALVCIPRWEQVPEGLVPRDRPSTGRLVLPPGVLAPGRLRVVLPALKQSCEWELEVSAAP